MSDLMPQTAEHPMITEAKKRGFVPGAVHNSSRRENYFYLIYNDDEDPVYDEMTDRVIFSGIVIYAKGQWAQIWNKETQKFES